MNERRSNRGLGLLPLVPIACCLGITLVAATGISVAAAWAGGITVGAAALVAVAILFGREVRRRHRQRSPFLPISRGRP